MEYHAVVRKIINILEGGKVWFEVFEHESVRTSEEAAKIRTGYSLKQGAKTIIIKAKTSSDLSSYFMLVLPGDKKFDSKKVKKALKIKDIRFATEVEVLLITDGVQPGGVPPFGNIFGLQVIVDPTLIQNERIIFNAGDRRCSIAMKTKDYVGMVKPAIESIV